MWTSFGDWCKVTFFSHNCVDFTSVGTYDASYWITPLENMYYGSHLLHTLECEKNVLYLHPVHHCTFTKTNNNLNLMFWIFVEILDTLCGTTTPKGECLSTECADISKSIGPVLRTPLVAFIHACFQSLEHLSWPSLTPLPKKEYLCQHTYMYMYVCLWPSAVLDQSSGAL